MRNRRGQASGGPRVKRVHRVPLLLLLAGAAARADTTPPPAPPAPTTAAIADVLAVEGAPVQAPTHGGEWRIVLAQYTLHNLTAQPLVVEVSALTVRSEVRPDAVELPIAEVFEWDSTRRWKPERVTLPAHATLRVGVRGAVDKRVRDFEYHVHYWHEATFRAAGQIVRVRASDLWFRHPHPRRR
jgi:hypothetical protein